MIDPEEQKLASLCVATQDRPLKEMAEILDAMLHRIIKLERRLAPRDPHPNELIGIMHTNEAGDTAKHLMHKEPKP